MGFLGPRVRIFDPKSLTDLVYSTEGRSSLKTSDGKTHYIDSLLMLKHDEIIGIVEKHFKHIKIKRI